MTLAIWAYAQETGATCVPASMRLFGIVACALTMTLLFAASAMAAPDRNFDLGTTSPTAAWNGKLGTGFVVFSDVDRLPPCGTAVIHDCDYTLLHVTEPGAISVETAADGPNSVDVALTIYDSDADGSKLDSYGTSDSGNANEAAVAVNDRPAGTDAYYLVEINYTVIAGGQPAATATFTPSG